MNTPARVWSQYQLAIFDHIEQRAGNAIIDAKAGSGKSSTIVAGMKRAQGESIFLAFNKAIADELKRKGVNARTFHSLVFGPVLQFYHQDGPSLDKLRKIKRELFNFNENKLFGNFAERMVGLARGMGFGIAGMVADVEEEWLALCDHHDLEPDSDACSIDEAIDGARRLFDAAMESPLCDFDDMVYRAVKENITLPKFDNVFVDEAQDTNPIQLAILRKIMRPGAMLVAVGDPAQAIYGFRGADSMAMANIERAFDCTRLPLSITYRCPASVVRYVQQWVPGIEARPDAPEGVVSDLDTDWNPLEFMPGDLVVCRKTAPLITAAFRCIRSNVPVQVLGRDIGQGLKALIKKMNAANVDQLGEKLVQWQDREVRKALADDDEAKAESIRDRAQVLLFMIDELVEGKRTIADLEAGIDWLFAEKARCVTFCTIHKSKGLEAPRVFWLGRSECPAKWARKPWQREQEINLCYVAGTRAINELYFIEL